MPEALPRRAQTNVSVPGMHARRTGRLVSRFPCQDMMLDPQPDPSESAAWSRDRFLRTVRICGRRMGLRLAETDLDDVVQEVMLACWLRRDQPRDPSRTAAWIYGIARIALLERARFHQRLDNAIVIRESEARGGVTEPCASDGSEEEIAGVVHSSLSSEATTVQRLFVGRFLEEKTIRQLADELDRTEISLRRRLDRARVRLRGVVAATRRRLEGRAERSSRLVSEKSFAVALRDARDGAEKSA